MRLLPVSVYIGIMRCTENDERPLFTIQDAPFSGRAFDDYRWFRSTVNIRVQDQIEEIGNGGLVEITDREEISTDHDGQQK